MSISVTPIPRLIDLAAPAFTLGTANAAGSAATAVASDSTLLAFDTTVPTTIAYAASPQAGSAVVAARRDHTHGMAAASILQSSVVAGSRTALAGTGAQAITGAGMVPPGLIVLAYQGNQPRASWGFGDDAGGDDAIMIEAGNFLNIGGQLIFVEGGSDSMVAVLTSLDADGCTITWTKSGAGMTVSWRILFLR